MRDGALIELPSEIEAIARAAGKAILAVAARADFGVRRKPDNSAVTDADLAAHDLIAAALARLTPAIPVLSEEDEAAFEATGATTFWAVDPLDGTQEFVQGGSEYCVNIGLVVDGLPHFGVVHHPAEQCSFVGQHGAGAWLVEAGGAQRPLRGMLPWSADEEMLVLTSRWHRSRRLQALLDCLPPHRTASRGAALKIAHVADARAHASVSAGGTKVWDTAAGDAIVRACGGKLVGPDGAALLCVADSRANPAWIASGISGLMPGARLVR